MRLSNKFSNWKIKTLSNMVSSVGTRCFLYWWEQKTFIWPKLIMKLKIKEIMKMFLILCYIFLEIDLPMQWKMVCALESIHCYIETLQDIYNLVSDSLMFSVWQATILDKTCTNMGTILFFDYDKNQILYLYGYLPQWTQLAYCLFFLPFFQKL